MGPGRAWDRDRGDPLAVDVVIRLVPLGEPDPQGFERLGRHRQVALDAARGAEQFPLDPRVELETLVGLVAVAGGRLDVRDLVLRAIELIDPPRPPVGALGLLPGELQVVGPTLRGHDERRPRGVEGQEHADVGDPPGPRGPLVPVPVAVLVDPVVEGRDRADRDAEPDPVVEGGDPVGRVRPAGLAREPEPVRVDFGPGRQDVERAAGVEDLQGRRAPLAEREGGDAVVVAAAARDRVVAVAVAAGVPLEAVHVVVRQHHAAAPDQVDVPGLHVVGRLARPVVVPADADDAGGLPRGDPLGYIEEGGDRHAGPALVRQLLDRIAVAPEGLLDSHPERPRRRPGPPQAEDVQQRLAYRRASSLPVADRAALRERERDELGVDPASDLVPGHVGREDGLGEPRVREATDQGENDREVVHRSSIGLGVAGTPVRSRSGGNGASTRPSHPGSALDKMFDANRFHKGQEGVLDGLSPRDRFTDRVSAGGAPRAGRVVRARRRGRALPGRLLRLPPRLAHAAGRPAQRRDPGVPLPAAPRGAARPVGQRDLPPGRLGRRRGGGEVLPGAAHGQRSGAADEPDLPDRRPRVGGLHRRGRRAAPVARRHGRGRVPVSHEPPLLPVRVDGGQPGPPGGAAAARGLIPRGQVARAGRGGIPVRHHRVSPPARGEPGREDPRVHRRPPDPLGRRRRAAPGQGRGHREHPRAVPGLPRPASPTRRSVASTLGSPGARRNSPSCAARTRGPSCGSSSPPRSSGPGGTSASATSTATARPRCSSPRTSPGSATTSSRSVA